MVVVEEEGGRTGLDMGFVSKKMTEIAMLDKSL